TCCSKMRRFRKRSPLLNSPTKSPPTARFASSRKRESSRRRDGFRFLSRRRRPWYRRRVRKAGVSKARVGYRRRLCRRSRLGRRRLPLRRSLRRLLGTSRFYLFAGLRRGPGLACQRRGISAERLLQARNPVALSLSGYCEPRPAGCHDRWRLGSRIFLALRSDALLFPLAAGFGF